MNRIAVVTDASRLGGLGAPIVFLVSSEAQWISGQVIHSEGGFLR
jgi:NAD(P)-dependent dehydrogenase (short-subunit alcohol dehydrogenase family)